MPDSQPEQQSNEVPKQGTREPTVAQPLSAPARRPLGTVLVMTVAFFALLALGYLAALQWLVD